MDIQEILHDIVKLLPHRQEALDEVHAKIKALAPEQPHPVEAAPPATGQEGGAPPA